MADTFNLQNKKISASSLFGGDKVEKYRQELIAEGKIPGTKLNATSEERVQAFKLYRKNKIDFKNFVEKVLQKKNSVAYSGISKKSINTKRLTSTGALIKAPKNNLGIILKKSKETSTEETQTNSSSILKILESILNTLRNQFKFDKKKSEEDRKEEESGRRKKREDALEGVKKIGSKIVDKLVAPFKSILDKIFNFIFFTLLGRAFTKLMDWLGDPKNSQKVAVLGRFLKDWWPALLGLYFMPFKGFMLRTLGRIAWFTAKLALRNPVIAAAAIATAGTIAKTKERKRLKPELDKQRAIVEEQQKQTNLPWYQKLGLVFAKQELTTGAQQQALGTPVPGAMYASGGLINSNTGTRITGAGRDTQLTALQPGEIVMNRAAVRGIGADKLLNWNSMYGGSNANKPKYTGNIQTAADGGMVGGLLNQLGKFLPGTGNVMAPLSAGERDLQGVRQTMAGYQNKFLGIPMGYTSYPRGGSGQYSPEEQRRFASRSKTGSYFAQTNYANGRGYTPGMHGLYTPPGAPAAAERNNTNGRFSRQSLTNLGQRYAGTNRGGTKDQIDKILGYDTGLQSQKDFYRQLGNEYGWSTEAKQRKALLGKKGGGLIGENTGMNISGATADRQQIAVQPGEYILPKDTVDRLGVSLIDRLVAMTDNNSTAAKLGARSNKRYTPGPLSRAGRGGMMMLPPITQSGGGGGVGAPAAGTQVPSFSAVSPSGGTERAMNASIYGIVG